MMRIPHIGRGPVLRVAGLVLAALLPVLLPACRDNSSRSSSVTDAHYAQLDKSLKVMGDIDSLEAKVRHYRDQGDVTGEIMALKYYGRALRHKSRFDEAIAVHKMGLEKAKAACDTLEIIIMLNNLGSDYRHKGNLSKANGIYYKSLRIIDDFDKSEGRECQGERYSALNSIGNIELELRHYAQADSLFHQSLRGAKAMDDHHSIAVCSASLGHVKRELGELDSARQYYNEALKNNRLVGDKNGEAQCHLNFGKLYADERNYSHAEAEYKWAYDKLKEQGDTYYWLEACLSLVALNTKIGETGEARRYLQEAEAEALRINSIEQQAKVYNMYFDLAMKEGDVKRALDYHLKSEELYDSIYGLEKNNEMRHQIAEYEANVKQGEMKVLNKDIERLHRTRNMMGLFTILLIVMAGAIIAALLYATRVRLRTQRLMRQVEETRSLFFTNVVHQLRTPLTAIMGAADDIIAQAAAQGDAADRRHKSAEVIERQGSMLLLLVDRILEVGGVRSDLKGPDWRTGDVVSYLRMIVESYREACINRQIELTYVPNEKEAQADLVPGYLNTIVGNLIENAINYSNDYCKINVTLHVEDGLLTIKVSDNGIGIGEDDMKHVFDPFYRAARAEQLCEGVGIGLTVVRDMATVMGGSVAVESTIGEGSVFTVTLPCRYRQQEPLQPLEMVVKPVSKVVRKLHWMAEDSEKLQPDGNRPAVLIVEDHADVAHLIGAALGKEFSVHYASNGDHGLARAIELMPNLIITDVKMPFMDGLEMCRRVRGSRQLRHIPVIVLSARNSSDDRISGIEAGADAYMVKPFNSDELKILATKLLENRKILQETFSDTLNKNEPIPKSETAPEMDEKEFLAAFAGLVDKLTANGVARLNMGEIALPLKMGESQLRKRILELTGKSVSSYILQLRLERAMRMLSEHPTMLVGDVAEQCGFSDVAYFSKVFRQHYKMTPTQARGLQ